MKIFNLNEEESWALAQLFKRLTWDDLRSKAVDDAEADCMRSAIETLQKEMAINGINPR